MMHKALVGERCAKLDNSIRNMEWNKALLDNDAQDEEMHGTLEIISIYLSVKRLFELPNSRIFEKEETHYGKC